MIQSAGSSRRYKILRHFSGLEIFPFLDLTRFSVILVLYLEKARNRQRAKILSEISKRLKSAGIPDQINLFGGLSATNL